MRTTGYGAVSGGNVTADDAYLRISPHSRDEDREEANRRAWRQTLATAAAVNAAREGKGTKSVAAKPKPAFTIDPERVRAKYEAGDSLDRLALRHGVARNTIRQHILDAGGTIRPPKRAGAKQAVPDVGQRRARRTFPPDGQLRAEYEDGAALRDVALAHGISRTYVRQAILRAGGDIRPKHVNTGRREAR